MESLLPSTKIQSRWRSHQIFGATALGFSSGAVCHACEGLGFPFPVPSILAHLLLEQYLLDCCQSKYGDFGVPASSSLPPPIPSRLTWLLLEQGRGSGASASSSLPLLVPSVLALLLLELNRIHRSRVPLFFLQLASDIGLSKPFYVYCTSSLSNKKTILFHFVYPFFFAITVL